MDGNVEPLRRPRRRPPPATSYEPLETQVSCVLTRFRLRSLLALPRFYRAYRRIRRDARKIDGLLATAFLIESLRTCYTFSLWRDDRAILEFNTVVHAHIHAANHAFGPTFRKDLGRPEIFSAQFRLHAASHNLNWEGLDLRAVLAAELGRRPEEVATGDHLWRNVP